MDLFEKHLAAFPYDVTYAEWKSITNHVTEEYLSQILASPYVTSSEEIPGFNQISFNLKYSFPPEESDATLVTKYSIGNGAFPMV
jgi:hypothetical protein